MGEDRTPNGVGSRLAYGAIAHSKSQCPPFACDWNPWNDFGFIFLSDELCDIFRCFAISYKWEDFGMCFYPFLEDYICCMLDLTTILMHGSLRVKW